MKFCLRLKSKKLSRLQRLVKHLIELLEGSMEIQDRNQIAVMTKLENLTQKVNQLSGSVAQLGTAVDAAVAVIQSSGANSPELDTLAGTVESLNTTVTAQAQRLADAVSPQAPAPEPEPASA